MPTHDHSEGQAKVEGVEGNSHSLSYDGVDRNVERYQPQTPTSDERKPTVVGVNALKEWTGKERASIIFDSVVDEFTHHGLFNKVKGKANIVLIATTTEGDVFGGFYSVAVTEQDEDFYDPDMFVFSFESHGRCETPQMFVVKEGLKKEGEGDIPQERPLRVC